MESSPGPAGVDALVRRLQQGDRSAFPPLFEATQRELRVFLSAHAPSIDVVDEVMQAAYVAAYQNLAKYEPRGTYLAWLKGFARNLLLKELHARSRAVPASLQALEDVLARGCLRRLESDEDRGERLAACLEKLPPRSRELLAKRYAENVPVGQIARVLRKTESWVAVTLFRVREALRACLAGREAGA